MNQQKAKQQWDPGLYDGKMNYVSAYGSDLIAWLQPEAGEHILDLGCGTGDLAAQLADAGCKVTGMDVSAEMINAAKRKFPEIDFTVGDGENFRYERPFDAVFSNAALHWMKRPEQVAACVYQTLKPGGRFAAEFGGKGNMAAVIGAIRQTIHSRTGREAVSNPWYFPSIGEYAALLEKQGFRVTQAAHFDRPTPLPDGESGIAHWLDSFAGVYFAGWSAEDKRSLYEDIAVLLKPKLFRNGQWHADYVRIRILAVKPE